MRVRPSARLRLTRLPDSDRLALQVCRDLGVRSAALQTAVAKIARLPRSGWLARGVPLADAETVLQHSVKVSFAAEVLAVRYPVLDRSAMVTMALVHDLPEAVIGDRRPGEVSVKQQLLDERRVWGELERKAPQQAGPLCASWERFERRKDIEAILLCDLDRMDAAVQALVYGQRYPEKRASLMELVEFARGKVHTTELLQALDVLPSESPASDLYAAYVGYLRAGPAIASLKKTSRER